MPLIESAVCTGSYIYATASNKKIPEESKPILQWQNILNGVIGIAVSGALNRWVSKQGAKIISGLKPELIKDFDNVVTGVMSFDEMDAMMYKIEGEDLYLIGTSEHSMIGKFIDQIIPEATLPLTLTSYSPCFRKEKGAHGIEERGVYRIHQFEKQEMIVVCKPEESPMWFDKLWQNTVDLFRSMDIPVRTLECCSGDLADLKVKSFDVEAWSPRQKKYFEVGSCSNLGDAQARRLRIRVAGEDKKKYLAHTLNNTVVAPPRMLIAFLENNLQADGSVRIPEVLRPYMGGKEVLIPKK